MRLILLSTIILFISSIATDVDAANAFESCSWELVDLDPETPNYSADDLHRCRDLIVERSEKNNVAAIILRSQLALQGIGERKSRRNARLYLEAASEAGAPLGKRLLAELLTSSIGADKEDYIRAEKLYIEAASAGDLVSNSRLAQLYADGKVPGKSTIDIGEYFQKNIGNDPIAMLSYAKILLSSEPGHQNHKKASSLLFEAAKTGNSEASFLFAMLNINNTGVANVSLSELQNVICRSAEEGYAPAKYECAKFLIDKKNEHIKSIKYLEEAADEDHVDSIVYLAKYLSETGNSDDLVQAKKLWFRASTLGSDVAKLELIYRFDSLTRPEQLNVNGAFTNPEVFSTDVGRIMLGNHNLSVVARGKAGEYIEGEYLFYRDALQAFSIVANSDNKLLAMQAQKVADELTAEKESYEAGLKARRKDRKSKQRAEFWAGVVTVSVAILSLSGNHSGSENIPAPKFDSCAGINGLAWHGVSAGAVAFAGCNPYSF